MICVSFGNIDFATLKNKLKKYETAEIRLDLIDLNFDEIKEIFSSHKNLIATLRFNDKDKTNDFKKVETAVKFGAAYLDIDMNEETQILNKCIELCKLHNCKLILSYHNHTTTPSLADLKLKVDFGFSNKADIVKIVCTANTYTELARIFKLYEDERPLIAFSMGEKGKISRLLAISLGSPFTYAFADDESPTANSQLSYSITLDGIKLLTINNKKLFAVCGKPISHSLSPVLFNAHNKNSNTFYCRALCLDYKGIDILLKNGFDACNVTAPYKEEILKLNYNQTENTKKLEAGNTIFRDGDQITIENTDIYGVRDSIVSELKDKTPKTAIILGAGGAAKAAILAMKTLGIKVIISNRTIAKAKELAKKFDCEYISLSETANKLNESDILINTLPANADFSFSEYFHDRLIILDADYKNKKLEAAAKSKSSVYISGESWLLNQAIPAFSLFTGKEVNKEKLKESMELKTQKNKNCIVLIGMMKSGKSTIGKQLAEKLGFQHIDTDAEIEKTTQMSISEIFEKKGEKYFRDIESEILCKFIKISNIVISTGGGIICDQTNREKIKKSAYGIWLFAEAKELANRANIQSLRPKLKQGNHELILKKILNKRLMNYAEASEFLVVTDKHKPEQISEAIYEEINTSI